MLSQTTEYALRAMSCLAYAPDELTPTPALAKHTKVPANYLAKVLQSLSQAKLITGRRGVGGGYRLAKPADQITMLDVVNAIDPVQRIESCPLGIPGHSTLCALHRAVDAAAAQLIEMFSGTTMADLVAASGGSRPLCDEAFSAAMHLTVDGAAPATPPEAAAPTASAESNGASPAE